MSKKALSAAALVSMGSLLLAGCGGSDDDSMSGMSGMNSSSSSPSSSVAEDFNDADVTFATDMIPHHRQAVEMAELAETRSKSAEVKNLASDIKDAQGPEIETMTSWLQAWGAPVPEDMGGMDHSSGSMSGMMSSEDMDNLMNARGAEFDRMFLSMMIEHHEGAIEMAKVEQAEGANADAIALAERIVSTQSDEIATMEELLQ